MMTKLGGKSLFVILGSFSDDKTWGKICICFSTNVCNKKSMILIKKKTKQNKKPENIECEVKKNKVYGQVKMTNFSFLIKNSKTLELQATG